MKAKLKEKKRPRVVLTMKKVEAETLLYYLEHSSIDDGEEKWLKKQRKKLYEIVDALLNYRLDK